jgi:hypothetical protein
MDAKLLATIIAIAKKEAGTQARDLSVLERKVEDKLKEFHERSPILDTPSFTIKDGCLYCQWSSGLVLDLVLRVHRVSQVLQVKMVPTVRTVSTAKTVKMVKMVKLLLQDETVRTVRMAVWALRGPVERQVQ